MPFGSMRFINNLTGGVLFFSVILITSCKRNNPHPSEVSIIKRVESLSDKFDKSISEKRHFEIIEWEGTNVLNELNAPLFNAHPGVGFIRLKVAWQLAAVAKEQSNSAAFKSYSRHCELFAANLGLTNIEFDLINQWFIKKGKRSAEKSVQP